MHKGTKAWLELKELHSSGASSVTHPWPQTSRGTLDKNVKPWANWFRPILDLKISSWTCVSLPSKNITFSPSHILCHQQTCLEPAPHTCGVWVDIGQGRLVKIMCNWSHLISGGPINDQPGSAGSLVVCSAHVRSLSIANLEGRWRFWGFHQLFRCCHNKIYITLK